MMLSEGREVILSDGWTRMIPLMRVWEDDPVGGWVRVILSDGCGYCRVIGGRDWLQVDVCGVILSDGWGE